MTEVMDYRSVLEEKLIAKKTELESTQENLRKYANFNPSPQNAGNTRWVMFEFAAITSDTVA